MSDVPSISVIIPMYNAEKYFAECLNSLLAQTFQDFELIVVNDCSTDSSRAIAESYIPKFGGRLKIFDNEKNSGAAATRNNGLRFATGEYVYFMDSDDMILDYALEKMHEIAKRFDVDIVHCMGYYRMSEDGKERTIVRITKPNFKDEFTLDDDLEWRMKNLLANGGATVRKFSRREFLINNDLFFPENIRTAEDTVWTHGLWCLAKKIVHTTNVFYLYRKNPNSLTRTRIAPLQHVNIRIQSLIISLKWIDNIMSKAVFFEEYPQYRYTLLSHIAQLFFTRLFNSSLKISPDNMYWSIKRVIEKNFDEYECIIPLLCTKINQYQKFTEKQKTRIAELEEQLKALQDGSKPSTD